MKFGKRYSSILVYYIFVLLYIILDGNKYVVSFLVLSLLAITYYVFLNVRDVILGEKDASVSTLLHKLDKTKKETEESYKKFLSLSKTLGSGVFMVDDKGKITFSNKDIKDFFGIDINNKDYKELAKIKPLYKFVNESYLLEKQSRKQITFEDHHFDLISTPLFEGEFFVGMLVLVHDITSLRTAEKFQKQFTADVSHELRTPLSAIKGFSEIMLRDKNMSEQNKQEFLGLINKESERMEIILNDLMVISRLDRLDYELEIVSHDIKQVFDEAISVLSSKITEKSLELEYNVEPCTLELDKFKISQVIMNMIKNAINYTDQGFIKIVGFVKDDNYIINICDSGIGINQENFENIFKRFYRVDKARSRDTGGSGLGLSISKNIILKHSGTISVESTENKGSTFSITLPIKPSKKE